MKLLYITSVNLNDKSFSGVEKKIKSQVEAFNKNGVLAEHLNFLPVNNGTLNKINRRMNPLSCNSYIDLNREIDFSKYDILYLRYTLADFTFIRLLKRAKKENPKLKVLVEIPTYPYDGEYKSFNKMPIFIKDNLFRGQLKNYVDYVVSFSDDKEIYGIKVINIDNGINLDKVPMSNDKANNINQLNIVAVANVSFWHGYDRLIKGISDFYKDKNENREVNFYIIGNGHEIEKLKNITEELNINKYIHFEGFKSGNELNKYFDFCDIAVDHLGLHRKDMEKLSSLKSKEYCARGIPFVLSHIDLAFEDFKYTYKLPSGESNIDINKLFNFKNNVCSDHNYKKEIREYSERFSWDNITKVIINSL